MFNGDRVSVWGEEKVLEMMEVVGTCVTAPNATELALKNE